MTKAVQLIIFTFFLSTIVLAQNKGYEIEEKLQPSKIIEPTKRALVVGISNYQDKRIPNLKYAHIDAENYAGFLVSPLGGNIQEENIYLLTNELATSAKIQAALTDLIDKSNTGDELLLYFSGHGDVESKVDSGYFLTYKTPFTNYSSTAISFNYLSNIIADLSFKKEVNVTLIADACRSGELAGNDIGGSQMAALQLSNFKNNIKFLSCLPNELSIEKKEWNGGVFTYHLLKGMSPLADTNQDSIITALETELYLKTAVPKAVSKYNHKQNPKIDIGHPEKKICKLMEMTPFSASPIKPIQTNTKWLFTESLQALLLSTTTNKNLREELLNYFSAVKENNFIRPLNSSAFDFLNNIRSFEESDYYLKELQNHFSTSVQDEANNLIKLFLREREQAISYQKCNEVAEALNTARRFTPNNSSLNSNIAFYQGQRFKKEGEDKLDLSIIKKSFPFLKKAVKLNPKAAHIHHEIGYVQLLLDNYSEAEYHFKNAIDLSPQWIYPYINLFNTYQFSNQLEKAKLLEKRIEKLKGERIESLHTIGLFLAKKGKIHKAIKMLQKAVDENTTFLPTYLNLGELYLIAGQFTMADITFRKALPLDNSNATISFWLAQTAIMGGRKKRAIPYLEKAIEKDSSYIEAHYLLGQLLYDKKKTQKAYLHFEKVLTINHYFLPAYYYLAIIDFDTNNFQSAKNYCKKALNLNPNNIEIINLLGVILINEQDFFTAKKVLESALPVANHYPNIYCNLITVYNQLGDISAAKEMKNKAFSIGLNCKSQ